MFNNSKPLIAVPVSQEMYEKLQEITKEVDNVKREAGVPSFTTGGNVDAVIEALFSHPVVIEAIQSAIKDVRKLLLDATINDLERQQDQYVEGAFKIRENIRKITQKVEELECD